MDEVKRRHPIFVAVHHVVPEASQAVNQHDQSEDQLQYFKDDLDVISEIEPRYDS